LKKSGIFFILLVITSATVFAATPKQSSKKLEVKPQAGPVVEAPQVPPAAQASQAPATTSAPQVPSVSPITQAVLQNGVLACVSRVNQVATFLTSNAQSGAFILMPPVGQPDRMLFSTSFELVRPNMGAAYASASFAPNQDNGCGAVYETVEYGASSCVDIEKKLFSHFKRIGVVKKDMALLEAGTLKVFLMPAGENGCVVIKKEVVQ
jgi:hypothetical protein